MARQHAEFRFTNEEGDEGFVEVSWGPWGFGDDDDREAPIMVTFDDAYWMGVDDGERFTWWLAKTLAQARIAHGEVRVPGSGSPPATIQEPGEVPTLLSRVREYLGNRRRPEG